MTARWALQPDETPVVRCKCSHGPSVHTGGYGRCHLFICGCQRYRDDDGPSRERHPAGKARTTTLGDAS